MAKSAYAKSRFLVLPQSSGNAFAYWCSSDRQIPRGCAAIVSVSGGHDTRVYWVKRQYGMGIQALAEKHTDLVIVRCGINSS